MTYLPVLVREFINTDVSRSGLNRCPVRHGVATLASLDPAVVNAQIKPLKTLKDCEPGFLHVNIKYLPQMADETNRVRDGRGQRDRRSGGAAGRSLVRHIRRGTPCSTRKLEQGIQRDLEIDHANAKPVC